jgi:hypothetical protein
MKRFSITIGIAVSLIPIFWILFLHFVPSCGEELRQEKQSPDGRYLAVSMERNCGATTRYVEHINLRAASGSFSSDFLAGTISESEVFTLENRNGSGSVEFEWLARHLKSTTRPTTASSENKQLGMM